MGGVRGITWKESALRRSPTTPEVGWSKGFPALRLRKRADSQEETQVGGAPQSPKEMGLLEGGSGQLS